MAQGVLPFKYEAEKNRSGMTALAGLPTYLDLASVCGLQASIDRHVGVRRGTQGWSDAQVLMSLILLNLAGGDCVDDLSILQGDPGFAELMYRVETHVWRVVSAARSSGAFAKNAHRQRLRPHRSIRGGAELYAQASNVDVDGALVFDSFGVRPREVQ
jgi:hypothetical protein